MDLPRDDIAKAVQLTDGFWSSHEGARIFITGGTGTIGRWLMQIIRAANKARGCRIELAALVRDERAARERLAINEARDVRFIQGDVRTFAGPTGQFDLCIHAAARIGDGSDPLDVFYTTIAGTQRVLELAHRAGARRFLLTSSGAVYGEQPPSLDRLSETYEGAPRLTVKAAYGNAKRAAEWITLASASDAASALSASIARIFAVAGPGVPLDRQFAFGSFVGDVVAGRAIAVNGDGRTIRSYLYLADVCTWLLKILGSGKNGEAYNVGSEHEVSIMTLARIVAAAAGNRPIEHRTARVSQGLPARYVPDTSKARRDLGVGETVGLEAAVMKTIAWAQASP
jgi:dTDP-glucose 4,6-dehydratase